MNKKLSIVFVILLVTGALTYLLNKEELPYTINLSLFIKSTLIDKNFIYKERTVYDSGKRTPDGEHACSPYQIEVILEKLEI